MVIKDFLKKFKKKDDDVLDLTKRKTSDIGNVQNQNSQNIGKDIDLTQNSQTTANESESDDKGSDALGFLGNLASGTSSQTTPSSTGQSYYPNLGSSSNKARKIKDILKELKHKLDNTYDRVYKLSNRIDVIERKIDRLERRAGL
jgi:hypothetical protein